MTNNILQIYHFILYLFWGGKKKPRSFRGIYTKSEKILIIVPLDPAAADEVAECVKSLAETGKSITILLNNEARYKFPIDNRLQYEEYSRSDLLFDMYPKFGFLLRLRKLNFDLAVDLDLTGNNFTSFCALAVKAPYKAGLSRKYFDRAYSICFQINEERKLTIAQNYVDLLCGL